jgi:hypothetical protein
MTAKKELLEIFTLFGVRACQYNARDCSAVAHVADVFSE